MLAMIWAQAQNRAIGKNGTMPWHVPEDMAMFKRATLHHPVIMGRKTWESLHPRWRPLPGRINYVVTRNPDYQAEGAMLMPSLEEAIQAAESACTEHSLSESSSGLARDASTLEDALAAIERTSPTPLIWLIGGAQLYTYACDAHLAQAALITDLHIEVPHATAYAPALPESWAPICSSPAQGWLHSAQADIDYRFTLYQAPHNETPQCSSATYSSLECSS